MPISPSSPSLRDDLVGERLGRGRAPRRRARPRCVGEVADGAAGSARGRRRGRSPCGQTRAWRRGKAAQDVERALRLPDRPPQGVAAALRVAVPGPLHAGPPPGAGRPVRPVSWPAPAPRLGARAGPRWSATPGRLPAVDAGRSTGCTASSSTSSPRAGIGARLHWIIHGVHHDHPNDPMRLVMPPPRHVPLARCSSCCSGSCCRSATRAAVTAASSGGYLAYDMTHYYRAPPRAEDGPVGASCASCTCATTSRTTPRLRHQRAVVGLRLRDLRRPAAPSRRRARPGPGSTLRSAAPRRQRRRELDQQPHAPKPVPPLAAQGRPASSATPGDVEVGPRDVAGEAREVICAAVIAPALRASCSLTRSA